MVYGPCTSKVRHATVLIFCPHRAMHRIVSFPVCISCLGADRTTIINTRSPDYISLSKGISEIFLRKMCQISDFLLPVFYWHRWRCSMNTGALTARMSNILLLELKVDWIEGTGRKEFHRSRIVARRSRPVWEIFTLISRGVCCLCRRSRKATSLLLYLE